MSRQHPNLYVATAEPLEGRRLLSASDVDTTFGDDGIAVANIGREAVSIAAAAQADGKIVVAGRAGSNATLTRFHPDGSVDITFGTGGVTRLNLGNNELFTDVFVLPTGKILAGGYSARGASPGKGFLARFRADGALDTGTRFGHGDGILVFDNGQSLDGMTVGGGKIYTIGSGILRRHNLGTGAIDVGFDGDGQFDLEAQTVLSEYHAADVAVSDAGKVALTGNGSSMDATERKFPQRFGEPASFGSAIVVLDPDGTLDDAFDANGVSFYGGNGPARLLYAPDGTLLAASASPPFSFESSVGLYEFATDGSYTFNPSRVATSPAAIGRLSNGKILIAGQETATRFNADGTLDTTYSTDGTAQAASPVDGDHELYDLYGNIAYDSGGAVILPDGAVVLTGHFERPGQTITDPPSYGPLVLRKVLAAPPPIEAEVVLSNLGTLQITGTDGDDVIRFDTDGENDRAVVTADQQTFFFPIDDVLRVTADLGAGDDTFDASQTFPPVPLVVDGEAGSDQIFGSNGDDLILGGLDGDYIRGHGGNDSLHGNGGKDTLYGDEGNDYLDGGRSNDVIFGGAHADRLIGGEGSDELYGESGGDWFGARDGAVDFLFGGSGDDDAHYDDDDDARESIERRLT